MLRLPASLGAVPSQLPCSALLPQGCAAPASATSRRPGPATAQTRTSSSSTWTADSGVPRASALRPQPAPPKLARSEGPGPGPGAAGAPRQSYGLSPCGNIPRELREAAALLLHPPVVSVILPLTQRTCWLLEAPPEHPSGASPKTPSLTPAVSRRRLVPPVPLLPASQTLGQGRGLSPSSHRPRDQALERDVAYQDGICVFVDCS